MSMEQRDKWSLGGSELEDIQKIYNLTLDVISISTIMKDVASFTSLLGYSMLQCLLTWAEPQAL